MKARAPDSRIRQCRTVPNNKVIGPKPATSPTPAVIIVPPHKYVGHAIGFSVHGIATAARLTRPDHERYACPINQPG